MGGEDRGGLPNLDPDLLKTRSRFVEKSGRPPRSRFRFVEKSGRPPRSRFVGKSGWPSRPDPHLLENRDRPSDLDLDPTRFLSGFYPPRDISPMVVTLGGGGGCMAQRMYSCFPPSTQQSRIWIPAPPRFFSLNCLVCQQYWDRTHLVLSNGFH